MLSVHEYKHQYSSASAHQLSLHASIIAAGHIPRGLREQRARRDCAGILGHSHHRAGVLPHCLCEFRPQLLPDVVCTHTGAVSTQVLTVCRSAMH